MNLINKLRYKKKWKSIFIMANLRFPSEHSLFFIKNFSDVNLTKSFRYET